MKKLKYSIILASLLLAQCNQGFGVLTKLDYDFLALVPCLGAPEPTVVIGALSPANPRVIGYETISFSYVSPAIPVTPEVSVDNVHWLPAVSGVTRLSEIPEFDSLRGRNFTLYLRDGACNKTSVVLNTMFMYRQRFYFDTTSAGANVPGDVANFPVLIRLSGPTIIDAVKPGVEDVRFLNEYGSTLIDYQIERWDQTADLAEVWVLVPTIYGNTDTHFITMLYGESTLDSVTGVVNYPTPVFSTANGFVGVWHLNQDPSGGAGSITNSTSNPLNGTPAGMVSGDLQEGQIGRCLYFNGTSGVIDLGTSTLLQPANITVSYWIQRPNGAAPAWSGNNRVTLFAKAPGDWTSNGWMVGILDQASSNLAACFVVDGSNNFFYVSGIPDAYYPADTWIYMSFTFNATGPVRAIYKNGSSQTLAIQGTPSSISTGTDTKWIAADAGYYWNGRMDELRISSVVRSADWVKLCYENQRSGQTLVK